MKRLLMCLGIALSFVGLMVVAHGYHRGGDFSFGFGSGYNRPYHDPYYGDPVYSGGYDPGYYHQSRGGRIASGILGAAANITDAATSRRRYSGDSYYY